MTAPQPVNFGLEAVGAPPSAFVGLRTHFRGILGGFVALGFPIILMLVLLGPILAPLHTENPVGLPDMPPSREFLFGTDGSGLDVFSRTLTAARLDIGIALISTAASAIFGMLFGLLLALRDNALTAFLMRAIDTVQALPTNIISFTVVALSGGSIPVLVVMLSLFHLPYFVRSIWSSARAVRDSDFVQAARRSGEPWWRITFLHIGLNSIDTGVAQISTVVGWSILSIAGISFLGGGVRPPTPEWGSMISSGSSGLIAGYWWQSMFPGFVLALCVLWFAAVSEFVRRLTTDSQ